MKEAIQLVVKDSRVKYLFVGGTSVLIEYGSFLVLVGALRLDAVIANIISFLTGFMYTFLLHNRWTFSGNHKHGVKRQLLAYGSLATVNIIATSILIGLQVNVFHAAPFIAKLVCMALVVLWNYMLLSRVIFKRVS